MSSVPGSPPKTPSGITPRWSTRRQAWNYEVRYRTPAGKAREKVTHTLREATTFKATTTADKHRGVYVDALAGRVTLAKWGADYWRTTLNLRPTTRARDELMWNKHVIPRFGEIPVANINRRDVREWVAELSGKGLAPATVQKAHQILAKVLRAAVGEVLPFSPCDSTPLPTVERKEMRFATPDELARLVEAIDPQYRAFALLGGYCGLRAGEMYGLRRKRVDILRRTIDVAETQTEPKGVLSFGPPKTRASRRKVPMPAFVAEALAKHLVDVDDDPDALVFTSKTGRPMRRSQFRANVWVPATKAAGLDGLRVHDLRHSAVAYWIDTGAKPNEIAVRAGHTSVAVVLDRYGHLLPKTDDAVTDALDVMARAADANISRAAGGTVTPMSARPARAKRGVN